MGSTDELFEGMECDGDASGASDLEGMQLLEAFGEKNERNSSFRASPKFKLRTWSCKDIDRHGRRC